ncbi:SCO family protein [Acidovorax lacteus]
MSLALCGCQQKAPTKYNGIDISGAEYGKNFRLKAPDGSERTLADFKGRAVMLFFGFTQCPDVCPTALARAAEVKRLLGNDGERLQVIFITIDPERDSPEMLKAYTAAFDPSFLALYADVDHTAQTAKEFKVYYKKVPTGSSYTMDHTALSYVYDPDGRLRLALRHEQTAKDYAEDIAKILNPT